MGSKDNSQGGKGLSRRDFLKASAAGAAGVAALDWAIAEPTWAVQNMSEGTDYITYRTTCPYCSVGCGQVVAVKNGAGGGYADGEVIDIWGDKDNPLNRGGLCAKGSASLQLAKNPRRIGVSENTALSGTAYRRQGDGAWQEVSVDTAMAAIATGMVSGRGTLPAGYNSTGVMFFGSSHCNNEQNYLYRKLVANFGTSSVEHQARI